MSLETDSQTRNIATKTNHLVRKSIHLSSTEESSSPIHGPISMIKIFNDLTLVHGHTVQLQEGHPQLVNDIMIGN